MQKNLGMQRLRARQVVQAIVEYSGGNDNGGVDRIVLRQKDGTEVTLEQHAEYAWQTRQNRTLAPHEKADNELYEALADPVYEEWGSFAGEFYTSGTYVWDVEENKVRKEQHVEVPSTEYQEDEW